MAVAAAAFLERRQALARLLPIRRRRVVLAQIEARHRQAELARAEIECERCQRKEANLRGAVQAQHVRLAELLADRTSGAQVQVVRARIDWLDDDCKAAGQERLRAQQARDAARDRLDLTRRRIRILEERCRQLERLAERARRLAERRLADRVDARFNERHAAERHAAARRLVGSR